MSHLFSHGRIVATHGALDLLDECNVSVSWLIHRHLTGDWGDACPEDAEINNKALLYGNRIWSVYEVGPDRKVWIITEADRSSTTVLLPEEY